jgi:hypothetical protein
MFKEGKFSDFKLIWNERTYSVHKCILSAESKFFQTVLATNWKDLDTGSVNLPRGNVSDTIVEVFLLFLYTSCLAEADFNKFQLELYDLSEALKVQKLKDFCSKNFRSNLLTTDNVESFVNWCHTHTAPKMNEIVTCFIATNYATLSEKNFPFHKTGKIILCEIFRRVVTGYSPPPSTVINLGEHIGDPRKHPQFQMYRNGHYADFKLIWNGKPYLLHKCVLFTESLYFQTLLSSNWKELDLADLAGRGISKETFEDFLFFLYTNLIREDKLTKNSFHLYDLSDYFQVNSLKLLISERIKNGLTYLNAESFISPIRQRNSPELKEILVNFIAGNYRSLRAMYPNFPFHKLGKVMTLKFFRKLAAASKKNVSPGTGVAMNPTENINNNLNDEDDEEDEDIEDR